MSAPFCRFCAGAAWRRNANDAVVCNDCGLEPATPRERAAAQAFMDQPLIETLGRVDISMDVAPCWCCGKKQIYVDRDPDLPLNPLCKSCSAPRDPARPVSFVRLCTTCGTQRETRTNQDGERWYCPTCDKYELSDLEKAARWRRKAACDCGKWRKVQLAFYADQTDRWQCEGCGYDSDGKPAPSFGSTPIQGAVLRGEEFVLNIKIAKPKPPSALAWVPRNYRPAAARENPVPLAETRLYRLDDGE